jgi:hypothetical protein
MALTTMTEPRKLGFPATRLARELALVMAAGVAYFGVRGLTEGDETRALQHADLVIRLEHALRIFWEPALQDVTLRIGLLVTIANWIYMWGH